MKLLLIKGLRISMFKHSIVLRPFFWQDTALLPDCQLRHHFANTMRAEIQTADDIYVLNLLADSRRTLGPQRFASRTNCHQNFSRHA